MKTVRIKRSKWSRGNQLDNALLITRRIVKEEIFRGDNYAPAPRVGTMCCLGFACRALGASAKLIGGRALPEDLTKNLPGLNDTQKARDFCQRAAGINDEPKIKGRVREQRLRKLAAKNGFKFVFVP